MGKEEKVAKEKDEIPKIGPQSITRSSKKSRTSVIVDLDQITPRSSSSSKSFLSPSKRGLEKFKNVKKATTSLQKTMSSSHHQEGKVQKTPEGLPSTSTANKPVASSSTASEDAMEWEPTESEVLNSVHQLRKSSSLPRTQITDIRYLHTSRLPVKQNNLLKTVVLHVVIDTNVFLSHLPVVKTLVDEDSCQNKVQIFVPWMVLQELDLIKTKAEHKNKLEVMARKAAMFINIQTSILKNPCFRIQTLSEYNSCINLSSDENADDKILQWCINLKKEIQENILLLSNDIIFSAKASANGIQAMLSQDFVDQLPQLLGAHPRTSGDETNASSSPILDNNLIIPHTSSSQVLPEEKTNIDRILPSKFLFQFEELILIPFSQFLEFEMKEAFDHIWLQIVLVKPPWNLYDMLRCVEKHWIAVFGYKYTRDLQSKFDHLKNLWKASKAALSLNDDQRDSLVQTAVSILQAILKVRHELGRAVNDCIYSLQGLLPRKLENDSCVMNVFTRLWERFNFICETIKMSCEGHVPNYSTIPSRQEIVEGLQFMIPMLNRIEDMMSRFFQTAAMNPSSLEEISTELSTCLLSATSRLGLQTESPTMQIEDLSRALLSFISYPEKKLLMENGLHQLRTYKLVLQSASSVLIHPSQ